MLLPQLLEGEGMEPPRAAMERCSCARRWAAVGMLGARSGPGGCPADGNACSSVGRISGPWATDRRQEAVGDSEADPAR